MPQPFHFFYGLELSTKQVKFTESLSFGDLQRSANQNSATENAFFHYNHHKFYSTYDDRSV